MKSILKHLSVTILILINYKYANCSPFLHAVRNAYILRRFLNKMLSKIIPILCIRLRSYISKIKYYFALIVNNK